MGGGAEKLREMPGPELEEPARLPIAEPVLVGFSMAVKSGKIARAVKTTMPVI